MKSTSEDSLTVMNWGVKFHMELNKRETSKAIERKVLRSGATKCEAEVVSE